MKNFVQEGEVVTAVAPSAGVKSGDGVLIGDSLFGIAATDAASGKEFELVTEGVFELPKAAGALDAGDRAYFDPADSLIKAAGASRAPVGSVIAGVAADAATVRVRLDGVATALTASS